VSLELSEHNAIYSFAATRGVCAIWYYAAI